MRDNILVRWSTLTTASWVASGVDLDEVIVLTKDSLVFGWGMGLVHSINVSSASRLELILCQGIDFLFGCVVVSSRVTVHD
jgi:hypothetical protein